MKKTFFETPLWNDLHFSSLPISAMLNGGSSVTWRDPAWSDRRFFKTGDRSTVPLDLAAWKSSLELDLEEWAGRVQGSNHVSQGKETAADTQLIVNARQRAAMDILLALSESDEDRETLLGTLSLPKARFWINYQNGYASILPHLARISQATRYFTLHATAAREAGRKHAAVDDIRVCFRLIEALRNEPIVISHTIRTRMLDNTLQPIWEGIAHHDWSPEDLKLFEQELQRLDFLEDFQFVMRGERGFDLWGLDFLQKATPEEASVILQGLGKKREPGFLAVLYRWGGFNLPPSATPAPGFLNKAGPSGWFNCDRRSLCKSYDHLLRIVDRTNRTISPIHYRETLEALKVSRGRFYTGLPIIEAVSDKLDNAAPKFARAQAEADLARVACAVERYWLVHHVYPKTLQDLEGSFLDSAPGDVITGKPLIYRSESGGYVLYSVAWNGVDDGGVVTTKKGSSSQDLKGDWVWRIAPQGPG